MQYALIGPDNEWLAGPLDEEPAAEPGERVEIVALGYPETVVWSQEQNGFVDRPQQMLFTIGRFKLRFTAEERNGIRAATRTNEQVEDLWDLLHGFTAGITLDDPTLVFGLMLLVSLGLLTEERRLQILDPFWTGL